jgi:glutaredoxin-related protein
MAMFKYKKYLAINIDFVNVLKTIFCFKNFSTVRDFFVFMAMFKYQKYLAINIDFVNVLKINLSWF